MCTNIKARIYYLSGKVESYKDAKFALAVYYSLPRGVKAVFRLAGDFGPIFPHDYVDKP